MGHEQYQNNQRNYISCDNINFSKSIRDPIYGTIRLSEEEMQIIDSKLFRRLHRIRQNGLLYFIFPAATHTRFEHSLGVLHISNLTLSNLLFNSSVAANKSSSAVVGPSKAKVNQAVDFNKISKDNLNYIFKITRFAALIHDLGHGPISHAFDSFAPKWKNIGTLLSSSDKLGFLSFLQNLKGNPEDKVSHEIISCILFAIICNDLDSNFDKNIITDVAAVILGKPEICQNEQNRCFIGMMHDIVASAPADADRMDYLERDSRSIGVTYGFYDRDRLLKSFLIYKENSSSSDKNRFRLGVKYSGIRAVENFIQARFQLFVQIYYHKTNRAIELMLKKIADIAKNIKFSFWNDLEIEEFVKIYVELSDDRFLRILRGMDDQIKIANDEIMQIAKRIFRRDLWKRVCEGKPGEMENKFERLKKDKIVSEGLYLDKVDPKATKDLDSGAALLRRGHNGVYEKQESNGWSAQSSIIAALKKAETEISRIYFQQNDSDKLKKLRDRARDYDSNENAKKI